MLYLLDTAHVKDIKALIEDFPIAGVTTNPTILAREEETLCALAKDIRGIIGPDRMLHVQSLCERSEQIVQEGLALVNLVGGCFYVKVPVTPEGIKAILQLKRLGVGVTATAIFTQQQALLAARAGADFVAPYVNRLDNIASNGVMVVSEIVRLFNTHDIPTRVLAASFKNVEQVHQVSLAGAHCVTVAPELLKALLYHPLTDLSVAEFQRDGPSCPQIPFDTDHPCEGSPEFNGGGLT